MKLLSRILKKFGKKLIIGLLAIFIIGAPLLYLTILNSKPASADWYSGNWKFRRKITIDYTKVSGGSNLTSFPVLINLTDTNLAAGAQSDGDDILFTSSDGTTQLNHQIESYNSTTGALIAWVNVTTLSASVNTVLYMYYGNASSASQQNATGVWDSSYKGVWHLQEASGNISDSTSNANNSTAVGGTPDYAQTGKINSAINFAGASDENFSHGQPTSLDLGSGTFTLQAWIKTSQASDFIGLFGKVNTPTNNTGYTFQIMANGTLRLWLNASTFDSTGTVNNNAWRQVAVVRDSSNQIRIYIDGSQDSNPGSSTANPTVTATYYTGSWGNTSFDYNGLLDEVRISVGTARTAGWIATEYNNQNSPSTFFTVGNEESSNKDPILYWEFNDSQGTSANDSTTSQNTGTLGGTTIPTWQTEDQCIAGKCLFFDGSTSKVTGSKVANNIQTISFWIRPNTIATQGIINLDGGTHKINTNSSGVISAAGFTSPTYYINGIATTTPTLIINTWNHVEITTGTSFNSTATFTIGTDGTNFIKGFIDEVKFYNYQRSAAQVKTDFGGRSVSKGASVRFGGGDMDYLSKGLVGYWKTDESSGNAADSSGNGLTLTNNSIMAYGAGKFGNAAQCDGTADYLNTGTTISGIQSVSFWVYPAAAANNYFVNLINSSAYVTINSSGVVSATGFTNPSIYVNNVLNGTVAAAAWNLITITTGTAINANAFAIGLTNDGSNHFCTNTSKIDEVRLYNRALSPKEISDLYNWAPGPIGEWNFEEGSGTTAFDSSSNGKIANITLGASKGWVTGKIGKAFDFDGANTVITTSSTYAPPTQMTLEAWIYPRSLGESGSGNIISIWDPTNKPRITMRMDDVPGASINLAAAFSPAGLWEAPANSISFNKWQHVAITYDGSSTSNTPKIYIDGVSQAVSTLSSPGGSLDTTAHNWTIGARSDQIQTFDGIIDQVRVFNYIRTSKQIVSDMNAGHPAVGSPIGSPVAYWDFDEGYGNGTGNAHNSGNCGSTCDGNITNMSSPATSTSGWTQSGKFGKALLFDGTNDYVAMPSDVSALKITSDITLSAWINLTNTSSQHDIICKYTGTASTSAYCLYTDTNGKLNMAVVNSTGPAIVTTTGTKTLSSSTWYHVAGALNTTLGSVDLFVNGVLDAHNTTSIPTALQNPTTILDIGAENAGSNLFNGTIDEPKIYNYALTADEVKVDMNRGSSEVLGAAGTSSSYQINAANQEYCVPGDSTSCAAPVGEWKLEEKTGTTANDSSGNGKGATITAGTGGWKPGKIGTAYNFDGADTKIQTDSTYTTPTAISVEAWVYPRTNGETNNGRIFSVNNTGEIRVTMNSSNDIVCIYPWTSGNMSVTTNNALTLNTWTHVAATYDGTSSSNRCLVYFNGVNQAVTDNTGALTAPAAAQTTNWVIGNNISQGATFDGLIDNFQVFNYARSAAQIAWDYNKGKPVGYWDLDECQGTTAHDSSGNNNTGTITIGGSGTQTAVGTCTTSSTAWGNGATGKRNYSLSLDGIDDYVTIAAFSPLATAGKTTTAISWGGWFYPTTSAASKTLLEKATEFQLTTDSNSMPICGIYYSAAFHNSAAPTTALTLSAWNHVLCTYDGTNINTYLNGKLLKQSAETNNVTAASSILYFGETSGGANFYSGQIDDVKIFNYALTATQVKNEYNNGAIFFAPSTGSP